jgi:hypothetical protein
VHKLIVTARPQFQSQFKTCQRIFTPASARRKIIHCFEPKTTIRNQSSTLIKLNQFLMWSGFQFFIFLFVFPVELGHVQCRRYQASSAARANFVCRIPILNNSWPYAKRNLSLLPGRLPCGRLNTIIMLHSSYHRDPLYATLMAQLEKLLGLFACAHQVYRKFEQNVRVHPFLFARFAVYIHLVVPIAVRMGSLASSSC